MARSVLKLKEQDKAAFFSLTEAWCLPNAIINRSRGEIFCGFPSIIAHAEQERFKLSRIGYSASFQNSCDGKKTTNGQAETQEQATVHVKEIGLARDSEALRRYTSSALVFAKNTDIPTSGLVVNYHILSQMAEGFATIRKTMCRSLS